MINTNLIKYPEQFATRISQLERDIEMLKREVKRLKEANNA